MEASKLEPDVNVKEELEARLKSGESADSISAWLPNVSDLKPESLRKFFDQLVPALVQHVGKVEQSGLETAILKKYAVVRVRSFCHTPYSV